MLNCGTALIPNLSLSRNTGTDLAVLYMKTSNNQKSSSTEMLNCGTALIPVANNLSLSRNTQTDLAVLFMKTVLVGYSPPKPITLTLTPTLTLSLEYKDFNNRRKHRQ